MRLELLYSPRVLCERLAIESNRRRRLAKLRDTPGHGLSAGHIDSLELLELAALSEIKAIYDIGANVGTWSLLAKSIIPDAIVHAFEPLPVHHDRFVSNLEGLENVTLHRIALGSENMSANLHVTNFSDATSMLVSGPRSRFHFGVNEVDQCVVQMRRVDDYRHERQLPLPDLVKIDVQGYELEVLKGGVNCMRNAKAIIAEVSFVEYYENQCLFHDFVSYLAEFGLYVRAFGINTPVAAEVMQTDVLFLRGHE